VRNNQQGAYYIQIITRKKYDPLEEVHSSAGAGMRLSRKAEAKADPTGLTEQHSETAPNTKLGQRNHASQASTLCR
jgi:hypothetical protein